MDGVCRYVSMGLSVCKHGFVGMKLVSFQHKCCKGGITFSTFPYRK